MNKLTLLAGIAVLALPVAAIADRGGHGYGHDSDTSSSSSTSTWTSSGSFDETTRADVTYTNDLDASIDVDVEYDKRLALIGGAYLRGAIDVNSSAVAVSDPKLLAEQNEATSNGPQSSTVGSVSGNGNVGVNAAAGFNNVQANVGAIATAPGSDSNGHGHDRDENAGWAEATTIAFQKAYSNDLNQAGSNTARIDSVTGNGNIGVNSAAGAFNNQANVLTMAVVKDGALAEANAGALLVALENNTTASSGAGNTASIGLVNANGNVGVNVAAGAGNVQHNSLTIATSTN